MEWIWSGYRDHIYRLKIRIKIGIEDKGLKIGAIDTDSRYGLGIWMSYKDGRQGLGIGIEG